MSYSVISDLKNQGDIWVWVYVNNKKLRNTEHRAKSSNIRAGDYIIYGSGGRTIFLNLKKGDTVYLKTGGVSDILWLINICFHFESKIL